MDWFGNLLGYYFDILKDQKNDLCSTLLLDHVTACMMDIRGVETLPILQKIYRTYHIKPVSYTHLDVYKRQVTAHAEMQAVTAAANTLGGKYLNECTLYVTVEPCVMCAGAIAWAQTGKLVFGAEDPKRGYQKYAPDALHPKTIVVKGILADECARLMKDFFKKKR